MHDLSGQLQPQPRPRPVRVADYHVNPQRRIHLRAWHSASAPVARCAARQSTALNARRRTVRIRAGASERNGRRVPWGARCRCSVVSMVAIGGEEGRVEA